MLSVLPSGKGGRRIRTLHQHGNTILSLLPHDSRLWLLRVSDWGPFFRLATPFYSSLRFRSRGLCSSASAIAHCDSCPSSCLTEALYSPCFAPPAVPSCDFNPNENEDIGVWNLTKTESLIESFCRSDRINEAVSLFRRSVQVMVVQVNNYRKMNCYSQLKVLSWEYLTAGICRKHHFVQKWS